MNSLLIPGSVLVGVDGSAASDLALAWAATHAWNHSRPLTVAHAAGMPVLDDVEVAVAVAGTEDELLRAGRRVTDRALGLVRSQHPRLPVTALGVVGDPREALARFAEDASVLVLGSRGRGALASLLLGSVSVALAAQAPCPVVVVRAHPQDLAPTDLSVVVGVDGDEDSRDALTFGFELACSQYRPLAVVHALGTTAVFPYPDLISPDLERRLVEASEELLSDSLEGYAQKFPDVVVHRRLVRETPTQALVAASRSASVVVVGCRGRSTTRSYLLGSVSRSVVEQAHCTVAVVGGGGS